MAASSRRRALLAGAAAALGAMLLVDVVLGPHWHTYAAYSDYADVHASARAGVWTPDPPAECGDISKYSAIVYGTDGNDTIDGHNGAAEVIQLKHGGNREIVMGLGGDDDLRAGNGKDCIVGGPGDDVLHGDNGKDILIGERGDDRLLGSNAPDLLDGGPGVDTCSGGNAPDGVKNCEYVGASLQVTPAATQSPDPTTSASP